jgi:hypothetical protein
VQEQLYGRVNAEILLGFPHRIRLLRRNQKKIPNWDRVRRILGWVVLIFWIMEEIRLQDSIGSNKERNQPFRSFAIKTMMM